MIPGCVVGGGAGWCRAGVCHRRRGHRLHDENQAGAGGEETHRQHAADRTGGWKFTHFTSEYDVEREGLDPVSCCGSGVFTFFTSSPVHQGPAEGADDETCEGDREGAEQELSAPEGTI